jgi:hypothetical protein
MKKIRLDVERLSVTTFDPGAAPAASVATSTDTQDRSCFEYCGPDDSATETTVTGVWWC